MTDDDEDVGLSEFDSHEGGTCSGLGSCSYCVAEDVLRREKIKAATPREFACRICGRETGGPKYCLRCDYKREQIHNERLYEAAVGRDE